MVTSKIYKTGLHFKKVSKNNLLKFSALHLSEVMWVKQII